MLLSSRVKHHGVHTHVQKHTCVCVYVCVCICVCLCACVCMRVCVRVCMFVYMLAYVWVCMSTWVHACVRIYRILGYFWREKFSQINLFQTDHQECSVINVFSKHFEVKSCMNSNWFIKFMKHFPLLYSIHTSTYSNVSNKIIKYLVVLFYTVVGSCNTLFRKIGNMGKAVTLK